MSKSFKMRFMFGIETLKSFVLILSAIGKANVKYPNSVALFNLNEVKLKVGKSTKTAETVLSELFSNAINDGYSFKQCLYTAKEQCIKDGTLYPHQFKHSIVLLKPEDKKAVAKVSKDTVKVY